MDQSTVIPLALAPELAANRAGLDDFDALVSSEQRRIYRFLLAMLRDDEAAETLTQECFLRAYQNRHQFRQESSVRTWLLRIAMNLARDHTRSRRTQFWRKLFHLSSPGDSEEMSEPMILEPADPRPSPERALLAREQARVVAESLKELSEQQRSVFLLRFVEEMSIEEIAQAMSVRPGTVKAHLFRAVATVRSRVSAGTPAAAAGARDGAGKERER